MALDLSTSAPQASMPAGEDLAGDLTALAWVHDELRRSLDTAHKSLRRLQRDMESRPASVQVVGGSVPPAVQQARVLVHQSVGVLEMIGLAMAARCLGAHERVLQRYATEPTAFTTEVLGVLDRVSFSLQDYLGRLLASQPVSPLALYPAYRDAMQLAGEDRIHPADLWPVPAADSLRVPQPTVTPRAVDARVRAALETSMLDAMRGRAEAQARLSRLYASLAAGADAQQAPLWGLAAAFFEAQAAGLLQVDALGQRLGARLMSHVRALERGVSEPPAPRLVQDLWFFCARAKAPSRPQQSPWLSELRETMALPDLAGVDYEHSNLGRFDPALVPLARRRVSAFKEIWSLAASGDSAVMPACAEQLALVVESIRQLYDGGDRLGAAMTSALQDVASSGRQPAPALAMEMATAVLCLEASLDDLAHDHPALAQRMTQLAERIEGARAGRASAPIEPWMETLYREVSDRQTMGSVVQELRAALAEAEQQLDRFHRHPQERELLIPVPAQLAAMRGVLNVLGLPAAVQAVQRMRADVEQMVTGDGDQTLVAARLADNLGVMSFLIDMLGVQPSLAKSLFRFDPDTGRFSAVMGRAVAADDGAKTDKRLMERVHALADSAAGAELSHDQLSRELDALAHHAEAADEAAVAQAAARARDVLAQADDAHERAAARADAAQAISALAEASQPQLAPAPAPAPLADEDDDMREVFFEEAAEVIAAARTALGALEHDAHDLNEMTTVRRAFHTLKGSSRMVQLSDYGETAWALEQLYNARLAQADAAVDRTLRQFSHEALDALSTWVDALAAGQPLPDSVQPQLLAARALALREPSAEPPSVPAQEPPAPVDELLPVAEVLPVEPLPAEATPVDALPELPSLDFALDLDLPDSAAVAAPVAPTESSWPDLPDLAVPEANAADITGSADGAEATQTRPGGWAPTRYEAQPDLSDGVDFELDLDLDLDLGTAASEPEPEPAPAPAPAPALTLVATGPAPDAPPALPDDDAERYKLVGSLRVPIALFNIYLNEADEQSRRLSTELAEWQYELEQPVGDHAVALAHSLAGNSATVGFADLSRLARRLEHTLERARGRGHGTTEEAQLYVEVAEEIRRLLHQFAAGFLREVAPELDARLSAHEAHDAAQVSLPGALDHPASETPARVAAPRPPVDPLALQGEDLDATDAIDAELFEIFTDEAQALIPALAEQVRQWETEPAELGHGVAAMRTLHTLKGGARLAGAMRLGEMAHRLETVMEQHTVRGAPEADAFAPLHAGVDALAEELDRLLAPPVAPTEHAQAAPAPAPEPVAPEAAAAPSARKVPLEPVAVRYDETQPRISWAQYASDDAPHLVTAEVSAQEPVSGGFVRVRAPLLDRLVSHAGEVGSARGRIESEVGQMRGQMRELSDNLERLRRQLRDLEIQAETQMSTRLEAARQSQQAFDPLEMDRFTRVQELTRMLAESVGDVGTVQRALQQALQASEDQLAAQARLTRDLQDDLLRARMVEFDTVADRLYRVVRQAAKESGKQVRLNLSGGTVELDRAVLDRMAPAFEHLLRNAVVHGIEPAALRETMGKPASGTIDIALRQIGNEVRVTVSDDGAGLNLVRIAERARASGLLGAADRPTESELSQLIFRPGFTTADEVTELAGRGIGMDVVRSEVTAMGGRVEISSAADQGTTFQMVLPLTTAVTQVVLMAVDSLVVAAPSVLVEQVRRLPVAELEQAYASGVLRQGEQEMPFYWLGALLQQGGRGQVEGRTAQVLIVRSAQQHVAVHVSEVLGNQEVVVKNLGAQLARLPGLAGMSLRASGEPVLIYNPVALAAVYGDDARARLAGPSADAGEALVQPVAEPVQTVPQAPLVLVVDDSLTVRRVTQRLLQREGYRVALARDGLEALEMLAVELPALMLSDIEMPRMDGFDLVRNVKAEPRWQSLPIVMITSRIAQKHRDHAAELGVDHYLGKPYDEETLLALVRQSVAASVAQT